MEEFHVPKALLASQFVQAAKGQNKAQVTDSCWQSTSWESPLCLPQSYGWAPWAGPKALPGF